MITELTQAQLEKMPLYVDKWIKIGIDTAFNEEQARQSIIETYKCANLKEPGKILFFDSPLSAIYALHVYWYAKETGERDKHKIVKFVDENISFPVCGFGQHEGGWLAFYDYFRNECGLVEETNSLSGLFNAAKTCGWYWAYADICFVSKKPTKCTLDDQNLLHSLTGPAIAFSDGFEIYAINGVMVTKDVVMAPESITIENINSEPNEEVKRIKIQQFGVSKFITEQKSTIIDMDVIAVNPFDKDSPTMPRALMEIGAMRYFVGTDGSTKRTYYMNVPAHISTCVEAHNFISPVNESNIIASS
jgi:hypothetical protein